MTTVACHPPADKLADFGLGRLDDEESRRFEEHLATCPSCQQQLEHQPGDRFVQLIQAACKPTRADPPAAAVTLRPDDGMRPATCISW